MALATGGEKQDTYFEDEGTSSREMHEGMLHEIDHIVELDQEMDTLRANAAIDEFFKEWVREHPDIEVKYMEVNEATSAEAIKAGLSPQKSYKIRTQCVNHGANVEDFSAEVQEKALENMDKESLSPSLLTIGIVATAIGTTAVAAIKVAAAVAVVATAVIGLYTLWRATDFLRPDKLVCPKDDKEFEDYNNFKMHFQTAHPNQEVPPKPTSDWKQLAMLGGIGVIAAAGARIVLPAFQNE